MTEIKFYGVRGSLPAPIKPSSLKDKFKTFIRGLSEDDLKNEKAMDYAVERHFPVLTGTFGGNTPCVQLKFSDDSLFFCDAGSGFREAGSDILANKQSHLEINLFLSHTHWDHIMGFPFFVPAYMKDVRLKIYGCHDNLEERMHYQQQVTHFPISIDQMAANIEFNQLELGKCQTISGVDVTPVKMDHPGDSYAYVFEKEGSKIIYSTDSTYDVMKEYEPMQNPFSNADVFIFDSMFAFSDYIEKLDWGHSTSFIGIDYAVREKIKNLFLFHHDPNYNDEQMKKIFKEAIAYLKSTYPDADLKIHLSTEGETFSV